MVKRSRLSLFALIFVIPTITALVVNLGAYIYNHQLYLAQIRTAGMTYSNEGRSIGIAPALVVKEELSAVPTKWLQRVFVDSPAYNGLTKELIDWLNALPKTCHISVELDAISIKDAEILAGLRLSQDRVTFMGDIDSRNAVALLNCSAPTIQLARATVNSRGSFTSPAPAVDSLRINDSEISEQELSELIRAKSPKRISIRRGNRSFSPEFYASLAELPRLELVSVDQPSITLQHLAPLSQSRSLKTLWLTYPDNPEGLAGINDMLPGIEVDVLTRKRP